MKPTIRTLSIDVDPTASLYNKIKGKKAKKKLERFLSENPDGEELIRNQITSKGALCAISYSKPLV